ELSGGTAPEGVESESVTLDEEETKRAERMVEGLVKRFKRSVKTERVVKGTSKPKASERQGKRSGKSSKNLSPAKSASKTGSKKRARSSKSSGNVKDVVETVSRAASSLVESVSSVALNLTGGRAKKGTKRTKR
ncbi:MAG TPA: hypothetical protein VJS44_06760, partial [Pyrinomonadaceae bacterium]|nr:hypothetical protein [Pyrinomonadaceae bacterium]